MKRRTLVRVASALAGSASVAFTAHATTVDATPDLRNSPKLATPERVKTDPFSGTAAYAYKIDVPPGTAGMTPSLVLTYSTQTQHSEYGYGWSLNLPYIERSTRRYTPSYHDPGTPPSSGADEFELGGDLLVREGTSARFHLRHADGSRILWIPGGGGHFEVTKPDGTRYLFAYNTKAEPAAVTWTLAEPATATADPVGGAAGPRVEQSTLADRLGPYEVKRYRIR